MIGWDALSAQQQALLDAWLPGLQVERVHSWGLVATTVLEVVYGGDRFIVKGGGPDDHHIARELRAHREWLTPWTSIGRAPVLIHGDAAAKLLVTTYLPGELVLGHPSAAESATYEQAGELLALLHGQPAAVDPDYERRQDERALRWLDGAHRIPAAQEDRCRALIASWSAGWTSAPAVLVPTHGDWQPRNWLINDGQVDVIDFGRADLRAAATDFSRLSAQEFRTDPRLEAAFLRGYGTDPRVGPGSGPGAGECWQRIRLREAIGTAAWAYQVGDEAFEQQGLRTLDEALAGSSTARGVGPCG